jgi:hypothetical protein
MQLGRYLALRAELLTVHRQSIVETQVLAPGESSASSVSLDLAAQETVDFLFHSVEGKDTSPSVMELDIEVYRRR